MQELHEGFAGFAVALAHLHHFVVEDHQLANRGVEAHVLDVARDLDDGLVSATHFLDRDIFSLLDIFKDDYFYHLKFAGTSFSISFQEFKPFIENPQKLLTEPNRTNRFVKKINFL